MKRIFCLLAGVLVMTACSKEEEAADTAVADDPVVVEEQVADVVDDVDQDANDDSVVVVEESAADSEPQDKTIVLAQADTTPAARNWKYKEGQHFQRLVPTQPTVGPSDKIEVAEAFMYSCPHCMDLETYINEWAENKDPNVRFVRIPAAFNKLAQLHAQLYFTEEVLAANDLLAEPAAFRELVFDEFHTRGNRMNSEAAIQRLFARAGVSEEDFQRAWTSFEVNQKMRVAADLARRYNVNSVPMIIVNGKYKTTASMAGTYPDLIELIDELTAREGLR